MKEKNNKGFTLIEMLVVVLIIGILAGIALPQYTNAVRKARVAEAQIILRAIVDATDRYYLATGELTSDIDDLDIEVSTESKNWEFVIDDCLCDSEGLCGCVVDAVPQSENGYRITYWSVNYDRGNDNSGFWGNFTCDAYNDNGHKICKSLGGQLIDGYEEFYKI